VDFSVGYFPYSIGKSGSTYVRKRMKNKEKSSVTSQRIISEKRQSKTNPEYSRELK